MEEVRKMTHKYIYVTYPSLIFSSELYVLNFIVCTSDKPTDLNYKNVMSVILSSVRFNKVIKAIIAFMTFKITVI